MPSLPPKPCNYPGCAQLVSGVRFCEAHANQANAPRRLYEAGRKDDASVRLRRGTTWRKLSELVRAQNPLCCDPYGDHARDNRPTPSAEVHHIASAESAPDLIFTLSNCAAVCRACHGRLNASERKGEPTAHLFVGKAAKQFGGLA